MRLKVKRTVTALVLSLFVIAHLMMYFSQEDEHESKTDTRNDDLEDYFKKKNPQEQLLPQISNNPPETIDAVIPGTHVFKSITEASSYMAKVEDIEKERILIQYANFSRHVPHFIDEEDYLTFMNSDRNLDNLVPNEYSLLRGVIEVVPNATFKMDYECGFRSNSDYLREPRIPDQSYDFLVPLVIPMGFLFQHFFDGTFPKIIQVYKYIKRPNVKILMERPHHNNVYKILEALNITSNKVVWHHRDDSKTVYHAKYMIFTCVTPPLHPELWKHMRHHLKVKDTLSVPRQDALVVYLTRAGATNGGRTALNEGEVIKFLRGRYGDKLLIFDGSKYGLKEAIRLFSKVKILIGTHGGAFYNMNYCPVSTVIIEFVPVLANGQDIQSLPHAIFWAMADLMGQQYWRIPTESINYQHDMIVNVNKLERILNKIHTLN